jgi:WD40 repeat protein
MNPDRDPVLEEEFTVRLLACEEALAMGTPPSVAEGTSPEMRTRLLRGLACLQRLQQLRPQYSSLKEDIPEEDCRNRIGRFEIRGLLGRGGFGIVYLAYDPVLCREVALKIPRGDALVDADCQARFQQEARVAARLHHPNLVPVHEAGQLGPICYIALAYCPGSDLATWLKQRALRGLGLVGCVEAASLLRTLARAIHYAHGCGVLHRDLKPSNILLSPVTPSTSPAHDKPLEHGGPNVFGLACSRDGKYILSGGHDRTAQVWSTATGEPLGPRMKELRGIYGVAFSADETQAITCGLDSHARFWDWRNGTQLGPALPQFGSVRSIHAAADGRLVLITSLKSARIWKTSCMQPSQILDHGVRIKTLRFGPDGTRFLTSGNELLCLWNVEAEERLVKKIRLGCFDANILLSPDGKSFAAYRDRQKIRCWDFASGKELPEADFSVPVAQELRIPKSYQKLFMAAHAFSPNGKTLLTGGHDNTARLWDTATGLPLGNPIEHRSSVPSVAFNGDGTLIATGAQDGTVRFWFAASGRPLGPPLRHGDLVIAVEFHPTRKLLATGCFDCKARFWQIPDPVQGDSEQIADWLRVVTGVELGSDDLLHALDGGNWKKCRERYAERGGPPLP